MEIAFYIGVIINSILILALIAKVIDMAYKHESDTEKVDVIAHDVSEMGQSAQKCLNELCDVVNQHSTTIAKHEEAIDYMIKEIQ